MTDHVLSHEALRAAAPAGRRPRRSVRQYVLQQFLLLPLGVAAAMAWANTWPDSYFRLAHALAFPVNAIGMALFLALVTQQAMEAVMPGGALHTWRRWSMPLTAAAGGIAGSALVYLGLVKYWEEPVLAVAWLVPCAIDLAAAYYVVRVIYRRGTPLAFMLLVGFVTDAVAAALVAAWPAMSARRVEGLLLVAAAVLVAAVLRRQGTARFWPFFAAGGLSWAGCYVADVHPALALVPIVPFMPHEPRGLDVFVDPVPDDPVHQAEHEWSAVVQAVLFLFGLVNAGVAVSAFDTGSLAVMLAAFVGRPLGMLAALLLATAAGLRLPRAMRWRDLVVIALATSCGVTLALFFAHSVLPVGAVRQQISLGALVTVAGAAPALIVAWMAGVGRFARRAPRPA